MVSRGLLGLGLIVVTMPSLTACRKKPDAGIAALDASADADTADGATAATIADASASSVPSGSARPAPSLTSMFEGTPLPPATPFAGSYRCLKGLQLVQTGSIVTGTIHTSASVDTVIACTAGPETCTGTVREIQQPRSKTPKVTHVKPVTLRRAPNGDVLVKPSTGAETLCRKI